ncbi:GNAT family N-acetyltransferase [bacterium]|nr:GNAT family N-acetyltransferase [bacterium]
MYRRYETDRTLLRPYQSEDEWHQLNDRHMRMFNEHWGPLHSAMQPRLDGFRNTGGMGGEVSTFVVVDKSTGTVVGTEVYSFDYAGRAAYLGSWILEEHRGKGFGIEAKLLATCHLFDNQQLEWVLGITIGDHSRAIRGMQLSGMRHLGIRPCIQYSRGSYQSTTFFGFSRRQWQEMDWQEKVRRGA